MTLTQNQLAIDGAIQQAQAELGWAIAYGYRYTIDHLNEAKKKIDEAIELVRHELPLELPSPPAHGLRPSITGTSEPTPAQFTPRGKAE